MASSGGGRGPGDGTDGVGVSGTATAHVGDFRGDGDCDGVRAERPERWVWTGESAGVTTGPTSGPLCRREVSGECEGVTAVWRLAGDETGVRAGVCGVGRRSSRTAGSCGGEEGGVGITSGTSSSSELSRESWGVDSLLGAGASLGGGDGEGVRTCCTSKWRRLQQKTK